MKSLENLSIEELKVLAQQAATTFNSTIKIGLLLFLFSSCSQAQLIGDYTVEVIDTIKADGVIYPYFNGWDSRDTVEFKSITGTVNWNTHEININGNNYLMTGNTQTTENDLLLIICDTDEKVKIILVYDEEGLSQIEIPKKRVIYSSNTVDLWAERVNHN